ncbi:MULTISPECIES: tyrosine-type recombinase/integrase [unclassified Methylobacterium]|uniref:tyrosine-type recombinase/integrase n=1 Tax=unclassified Methylobacterium TaxID=2615210 RepID=UPI0005BD50FC|nr:MULTISPECIES: tyrosine-type recombinase/integrase [unclassified Methylobacterium]SFV13010.1 integrase/recombinase XerD [Methylobacterium sp. UNCCL125]
MSALPAVITPIEAPLPAQADDDAQMVRLWLARSSSPNTRRNYEREARRFLSHIGKPLGSVRMGDLQDYIASRPGSSATVALTAAALKSLFAFAQEVGYLRFNIGAAVKVPPIKNTLAERIMAEADALLMIRQEPSLRNRVLLTVLYGGGLRISEVCGLRWRDLAARDEAGQATVFGKGGKTRAVLLSAATWTVLTALRGDAPADAPVFRSRKGGALDPSAVHRVVKAAAARAGLPAEVSAHWLRHAHASHSLDRGAPIHLVQATLGHASVATTGRYLHARPSESSARFLGV